MNSETVLRVISDILDECLDMGHYAVLSCPFSHLVIVPDSWNDIPIPVASKLSQAEIQLILNSKT